MKKKEIIEARVDKALESLDGVQRVGPGPFFFTRVMARLERKQQNAWDRVSGILARPVVAMTVLSLVVTINAVVAFRSSGAKVSVAEQQEQVVPEEYNASIASLYDYENEP